MAWFIDWIGCHMTQFSDILKNMSFFNKVPFVTKYCSCWLVTVSLVLLFSLYFIFIFMNLHSCYITSAEGSSSSSRLTHLLGQFMMEQKDVGSFSLKPMSSGPGMALRLVNLQRLSFPVFRFFLFSPLLQMKSVFYPILFLSGELTQFSDLSHDLESPIIYICLSNTT